MNASLVRPREVFQGDLLANASCLILAHNHPSGDPQPSNADKIVTETLVSVGKFLDVNNLDHVIVRSTCDYFSFRDSSSLIAA